MEKTVIVPDPSMVERRTTLRFANNWEESQGPVSWSLSKIIDGENDVRIFFRVGTQNCSATFGELLHFAEKTQSNIVIEHQGKHSLRTGLFAKIGRNKLEFYDSVTAEIATNAKVEMNKQPAKAELVS